MKERQIRFSVPMVRAIIDGRKTQTRRPVKPTVKGCRVGAYTSDDGAMGLVNVGPDDGDPVDGPEFRCPYGVPGDMLLVRETFALDHDLSGNYCVMPRWAPRLSLEVTDVRVEKLQWISSDDAIAEGINANEFKWSTTNVHVPVHVAKRMDPRESFAELWDSIYAARGYGWGTNPCVWVVTFQRRYTR